MKKILYLGVLTVFLITSLAAVSCGGGGTTTTNPPTTTSPGTTTPTSTVPNEVQITDDGFMPQVITIAVGEKVTWWNRSNQRYYVTSASKKPDTGVIAIGARAGFTFSEAGSNWNTACSAGRAGRNN